MKILIPRICVFMGGAITVVGLLNNNVEIMLGGIGLIVVSTAPLLKK